MLRKEELAEVVNALDNISKELFNASLSLIDLKLLFDWYKLKKEKELERTKSEVDKIELKYELEDLTYAVKKIEELHELLVKKSDEIRYIKVLLELRGR